jgi:hypothetical protein
MHLGLGGPFTQFCIAFSILLSSQSFAAEFEKKAFTQSFTTTSELNSRPIKIQVDIDGDSAKIRTFTQVDQQWMEISKFYRVYGANSQDLSYPPQILAKKFFLSKEGGEPKLYFIDTNNILQQITWKAQDTHSPTLHRVEISPLVKMGRFTDFTIGHKSTFGQPYVMSMGMETVPGNDHVTPITLFTPGIESGEVWLMSEKFGSAMKLADVKGDAQSMKPIILNFDEKLPGNLATVTGLSKPIDFLKASSHWIDPVSGKKAWGPRFPITDSSNNFKLVEAKVSDRKPGEIPDEYVLDARAHSAESDVKPRTISEKLLPQFEKQLRNPENDMDLETARAMIKLRARSDQLIPALTHIALQPEKKTTLWAETPMPKGQIIDRSTEAVDLLAKYSEIDPKALTALQKIGAESASKSAQKRAIASVKKLLDGLPILKCFMSYIRTLGTNDSR